MWSCASILPFGYDKDFGKDSRMAGGMGYDVFSPYKKTRSAKNERVYNELNHFRSLHWKILYFASI